MDTDKESLIGGNMKFKNPLLVVANIEQSKKFYWEVLGLRTISDCDLMIFKGNISCYILLLKYPPTLENTKFIAGELSLIVSLVLYLPTGHYEP